MPVLVVLISKNAALRDRLRVELEQCGCALCESDAMPLPEPDLVLVDVAASGDSLCVCRDLLHAGLRAPVLLFDGQDRSKAPDAGLLRKVRLLSGREEMEFDFGGVHVNFSDGTVTRGGMEVSLSAKQLQLLRYLIVCRGTLLSRAEILEQVWRYRATDTRTLDVHIAALRRKLEEDPARPRYIRTERRKGYVFQE
jgi:DNA-binding response OmpR family regulator